MNPTTPKPTICDPKLGLIIQNIRAAENILLLTHQDPDADALGSTQAFYLALKHLGKSPKLVYVLSHPKRPIPEDMPARIINLRNNSVPPVKLNQYDYALCLDCSCSTRPITGLQFDGSPRLGVGTIDHHSHRDPNLYPAQDFTRRNASSTCELAYDIINRHLLRFDLLSVDTRKELLQGLLRGMLEDMVGLTILEKVYTRNLIILRELKHALGSEIFQNELRQSRTLRLPTEITRYGKFFNRFLAIDRRGRVITLYLLSIPQDRTAVFKKIYNQSILLFDHYARLSCQTRGDEYGVLVLLMENFEPDLVKISARGAFTKLLFKPLIDRGYFSGCGISGNSALGGKLVRNASLKLIGTNLMTELKKTALTVDFSTVAPSSRPRIQAQLDQLLNLTHLH